MEYGYDQRNKKRAQKVLLIILAVLLFIVCAGGVVYLVWIYYNNYMAQSTYESIADSYVEEAPAQSTLEKNPVDFVSLKEINEDVYAWINVPNTKIDYPIVQSEQTDYYLRRSIYKKYLLAGCIYTNSVNQKDFSDPVTLVYGHNMRNDTMFNMLHKFEDKDFFDANEFFYIYLPGRKLTYRILSSLKYDNRRITTAFDFSKKEDIEDFHYSILNPKFELFNSRDFEVTTDDKIVTLSTCFANKPAYRYLVNGVLVKDEPTQ